MLHVKLAGDHLLGKQLFTWLSLESAANTHKRNKMGHFRALMKISCLRIYLSRLTDMK